MTQAVEPLGDVETIGDIVEVVNRYDLVRIQPYEHSGRYTGDPSVNAEPDPIDLTQAMTTQVRQQAGRIEARFKLDATDDAVQIVSDCSAVFASEDNVLIAESVLPQFLSEVALMAVFPYLREGVATSAARLEYPMPTLGLLRRGDLQIQTPSDEERQLAQ